MNDNPTSRLVRRTLGVLGARCAALPMSRVKDPRKGKVKLGLRLALTAVVAGIAAGCKGLGELEELTATLGKGARKALGIYKRIADTTLRDLLVKLLPDDVRALIYSDINQAHRRKQLVHDLPIRAASIDGRTTMTWLFEPVGAEQRYSQLQGVHAAVRTMTTTLVSVPGRPCLDAHPVPAETNEMGAFIGALDALLAAYGRKLFDLVMYDSGACSLANADAIVARGLDYLLCLTENQPTLLEEARRLLGSEPAQRCVATTVDAASGEVVTRRLFLTEAMSGYLDWEHLRTVLRIECTREDKTTGEVRVENRHYLTNLAAGRLQGKQWLTLIRRRWAVENECHNTFDKIFFEDRRPWILQPQGMLVVMMLRRLAYNILALYRSVTLRSEDNRSQPWRTLMRTIYRSLLLATLEATAGFRRRTVISD